MKSGEEPFECAASKFFGDCGPHHGARPLENRDAFGDCAQRNAAARAVIVCRKDLASASAADQPIVAYNISFDWNRALEPEYARLGLPPAGRRGFCAMTLARRVITGTENFKLESRR